MGWDDTIAANASLLGGGSSTVVTLGELMMILELHGQGLKVSAIARQLGIDRKTVRRYIARGLEPPTYGPRPPRQRSTDRFLPYVRERLAAFPGLTAVRLWRELRERGYAGGYTAVKRAVRGIRPDPVAPFEVRFETAPGGRPRSISPASRSSSPMSPASQIVWLFSLVLGYSRLIWGRFVVHPDMQSVLRCHIAALEAIGGAPREILYDRMKTAVIGEDPDGLVIYNRALLDLARHYGFQPRACRPYRGLIPSPLPTPSPSLPLPLPPPSPPPSPSPPPFPLLRPRARSSVRSATFARTSSWAHRTATSTPSMRSCGTGSTRSPIHVCMRPHNASSTKPSPRRSRR